MPMSADSRPRCICSAFTLLEVILALVILAGAVAVLGEVMSIAGRNAADAQAETRAQLLACSLMDEMVAGVTKPTNKTRQSLDVDDSIPWVYSVTLNAADVDGLTVVEVLVEQDIQKQFRPVRYRLVRWLSTTEDTSKEDASEEDASATGATEDGDG